MQLQNQAEEFDEVNTIMTESSTQNIEQSEEFALSNNNQPSSETLHKTIASVFKIVERSYSRHFIKALTYQYVYFSFSFIHSLRKSKNEIIPVVKYVKPLEDIKWPFRELFEKKYRNEDEQELFEFVNLCATMIQAKFKGYITRKRHMKAFSKAKKAKDVLSSFLTRWKLYRTFNCEKITEIRNKIKGIQKEINDEEENFTNRDVKKLKALYKYSEIHNKMFQDTFKLLIETGMWTLEKNMKPCRPIPTKNKQKFQQVIQEQNERQFFETINHEENGEKKERIGREKQVRVNRRKKEENENGSMMIENKESLDFGVEERPIKAAGQYQIQENYDEIPDSVVVKNLENESSVSNLDEAQKLKIQEKRKKTEELNKRKKYDPRQAIEEEKRKKKEKQSELTNVIDKKEILENKTEKIISKKERTLTIEDSEESPTIEAKKKQEIKSKNQEKQTNLSNSKLLQSKKVTSKVDCWVNRKEPDPEWVKKYKADILKNPIAENHEKSVEKIRDSFEKSIEKNERRKATEKVRNMIMKEEENVRNKSSSEYVHAIQLESLREKQNEIIERRKNSNDNFEEQVRMILEKKSRLPPRKKETHRPIEELEETYCKHYGERYRNLQPKLEFLAVARSQETHIPVIAEESEEFLEEFEQIYRSNQFWKKAAEYDRMFKSFISQ